MREAFYRRIRAFARLLMSVLFPIKIVGVEHIPLDGPAILCSNHISLIDPIALGCALKRPIRYMAKQELFGTRWFGAFLKKLGAFAVSRGGSDLKAVRESLKLLSDGELLGIYPQGHRYKSDEHREVLSGAAMIALRAKTAVIPVFMSPYKLFRRLRIRVGAPLNMSDLWGKADRETVQEARRRIADGIWSA
jgi:1-acyl-sn-glycerol-3-phosphate acyltransferase